MLGEAERPFAPDIHTLNIRLANRPGTLARVLMLLQHRSVNVESIRLAPEEGTERSSGTLAIRTPVERLDLLESKIAKLVDVLRVDIVKSSLAE